ncbi:hypothetical protein O181_013343 [Austropuccinia psidii MF-1]|uniref:Uncharacterized protein n=1 Tax=Austropuccinia psidii MF-1 TaxID=1389203 RepID=A0A9Q3BYI2_9BASI|nr:hypothetical protein [Austropuccinia psidii MF-1]
MLGTKTAFSTANNPQTGCLEEWVIQNLEDIIRKLCVNEIKYKEHEVYTHYWVMLLPEVQLGDNTSVHSVTGKKPAILEKEWNTLLPVDYLKKILLSVHPTAKDFQKMWKIEFDNEEKCILEAKVQKKNRYDKIHKEPDIKEEE